MRNIPESTCKISTIPSIPSLIPYLRRRITTHKIHVPRVSEEYQALKRNIGLAEWEILACTNDSFNSPPCRGFPVALDLADHNRRFSPRLASLQPCHAWHAYGVTSAHHVKVRVSAGGHPPPRVRGRRRYAADGRMTPPYIWRRTALICSSPTPNLTHSTRTQLLLNGSLSITNAANNFKPGPHLTPLSRPKAFRSSRSSPLRDPKTR
jgi:hypothetical protein